MRCNGAKIKIANADKCRANGDSCRAIAGEKHANARFVRVRAPSLSDLLGVPSRHNAKH